MKHFNARQFWWLGRKMGSSTDVMRRLSWAHSLARDPSQIKVRAMTLREEWRHFWKGDIPGVQKHDHLSPEHIDAFRKELSDFMELSREVKLPFSSMCLESVFNRLQASPQEVTYKEMAEAYEIFYARVIDELTQHSFYQLQPGMVEYYNDVRSMLGEQVITAFPSSLDEIDEAGKCLALGRSTACVFHLMRAFSPIIKAIAAEFSFKPNDNWGPFLNDFRTAIWAKYPDKNKANEELRVFYSDLEQQLRAIKDAWRNPTMHSIAAVYTEEKAEEIFGYVKGLMKKAAEKLEEQS